MERGDNAVRSEIGHFWQTIGLLAVLKKDIPLEPLRLIHFSKTKEGIAVVRILGMVQLLLVLIFVIRDYKSPAM